MQDENYNRESMMKKIVDVLFWPLRKIKEELAYRKKLKELRKKDPFIYK